MKHSEVVDNSTRFFVALEYSRIPVHERFLPARRYASAGYSDHNVSVRPSVCLSVRPSHAGIVSKQRKLAA